MQFFKQNNELTHAPEKYKLVSENTFINKPVSDKPLPTFEKSRESLPQPIWDSHESYIDCYWKTWEMAFNNLRKPVDGTGFVSDYIDTAFNGCIFMWDSAFMLMFGKYGDRVFKFQETLDNFYSHQHRDGFICREIEEDTGLDHFTRFDPSATGPEVMPWCEWEYYLNFGDKDRLEKVFPPLMAYHRWMAEFHTWPDGTYFSSGWGCGMDNLPRMMPGYCVSFTHGHMIWADACLQALFSCNILIDMAKVLGRTEFIAELEAERDNLNRVINQKLWDNKTSFYYDLWKNGEFNNVKHIGAYWALISKCASDEQAQRLISHLEDEKEFNAPVGVPSLSKDHPLYKKNGDYWCGGVWPPTNYMILKGLDRYGEFSLSHKTAVKFLDAVVSVFERDATVYENYAPEFAENGLPIKGDPSCKDFVGWTGLVPISIMFEYVFGIKPDAANKKIVWDVNLLEKHGIEKYPFGNDGELTLICNARKCADDKPEILFTSNVPVELEIIWGSKNNKKRLILKNEFIS